MATPTTISITPTACMNVAALTGSMRWTAGLRYFSQLTSMFVNLSAPASSGPKPNATRNAQYPALSSLETNINASLLIRTAPWRKTFGKKLDGLDAGDQSQTQGFAGFAFWHRRCHSLDGRQ